MNPIHWDLGEGLVIRTFTLDDDAALFEAIDANRDRLRPWMIWEPRYKSAADARQWIASCLESTDLEGNGLWVDGALAGGIGMGLNTVANSAEIGYWLAGQYEGRGLVTRGCARFFDFGFDELGLHRISLHAAVENDRSRAVAVRLGMLEEGVARDGYRVGDAYQDLVAYGILEDEWRAYRETSRG